MIVSGMYGKAIVTVSKKVIKVRLFGTTQWVSFETRDMAHAVRCAKAFTAQGELAFRRALAERGETR